MDNTNLIKQLTTEVLSELIEQGRSTKSIQMYTRTYAGLVAYTENNGIQDYNEAVGLDYMEFQFGLKLEGFFGMIPEKASASLHHLLILWHYQEYKTVAYISRGKIKPFTCPEQYKKEYEVFLTYCKFKKYTTMGLSSILKSVQKLLSFLNDKKVTCLKELHPSHLESFISIYIGNAQRYIATIIAGIKNFLKLLFNEGYIENEAWKMLPNVKIARNAFIPASWKKEDVLKLLAAVDRGDPMGKRDYALLLLVVRLGLRASDIRNLQLENLDWNQKKVVIIQTKTKQLLELPLLDDIGWAIIE